MSVSQDEKILADLLLKKIPKNQPVRLYSMLSGVMTGEYQNFDHETYSRLAQICTGNPGGPRQFLLDEDYLECIDITYPTDKLTDKGKIAKDKGGHAKYKEWEAEQKRKQRIEDFPKKKWYIYEPSRIIAGILITALFSAISYFVGLERGKSSTKSQPPKDTAQHTPKILDKKDTAK